MQRRELPAPGVSEAPALRIANRHVSAVVCLPDAECGYYRGTRFDWSGVVRDLRSRGHRYVSEWQPRTIPCGTTGLTGPADEFTQIGYEQAHPGQEFLKIGVGHAAQILRPALRPLPGSTRSPIPASGR